MVLLGAGWGEGSPLLRRPVGKVPDSQGQGPGTRAGQFCEKVELKSVVSSEGKIPVFHVCVIQEHPPGQAG